MTAIFHREMQGPLARLMTDPVWERTPAYGDFVEKMPVNGAVPKERTTVKIIYDSQALFVLIRAEDHDAKNIKWRISSHDMIDPYVQDCVTLLIDAVGSRKAAQFFRVNAAGSTADGMYSAENDNEDFGPDFDFDADAARDAQGYTVLLRIPLTTLRYTTDGQASWRLIVNRWIPRQEVAYLVSVAIPETAPHQLATMQELQGIEVPNRQFLQLRPSITALRSHQASTDANPAAENSVSGSLDVKWRPWADTVVDATLNPDFSQIELDVPQLTANKQFALSLLEKRPFFQESSDLWQAPALSLYTRTVTNPVNGLRATRRNESWAGTLFMTNDRGGGQIIVPGPYSTAYGVQPGSKIAALRVRADSDETHVGMLVSTRQYDDQGNDIGYNRVAGADINTQLDGEYQLRAQWLSSQTSALLDANGALHRASAETGHYAFAELTRRTDAINMSLTARDISADFRHDMAFVPQSDIQELSGDFNWIRRNVGNFNELWWYVAGDAVRSKTDGKLVSDSIRPGLYFRHIDGAELTLEPRLADYVRVSAASPILHERYVHFDLLMIPNTALSKFHILLDAGRIADIVGDRLTPGHRLQFSSDWAWGPKLDVSLQFDRDAAGWFRPTYFSETGINLVTRFNFSSQLFLRLIAQQHTYRRQPSADSLMQYDGLKSHNDSLVLGWRKSHSQSVYLGASFGHERVNSALTQASIQRGNEIFLKYQMDLDQLWKYFE